MQEVNNVSIYSLVDVINTLYKIDGDEAYEFASELTGLSVDALAGIVNEKMSDYVY
jgi:hypothetical protein